MGRIFKANDRVPLSPKRNTITQSLYVCHLGDHKEFEKKTEYVIDGITNKVFISDGAKWIKQWVKGLYPDCLHILDYYHAKEHLCGFAEFYFSSDPNAKNKWIDGQEKLLLNDEVTTVIKNRPLS